MFKFVAAALFFISTDASAFILISKNYKLSKPDNTKFQVSSEGCPGNSANLKRAMKDAIEIWNDVPESNLKLHIGSASTTSLASNTVSRGSVIIGCGTLDDGIAGIAQPIEATGSAKITLNNTYYATAGTATYGALLTTVTHELGHAIGLNHSKDRASVMTYESNGWEASGPNYLSQDDVDGVIYLYPNKKEMGGLLGSCSSYAADGDESNNFLFDGLLGFAAVFAVAAFINLLKKRLRP